RGVALLLAAGGAAEPAAGARGDPPPRPPPIPVDLAREERIALPAFDYRQLRERPSAARHAFRKALSQHPIALPAHRVQEVGRLLHGVHLRLYGTLVGRRDPSAGITRGGLNRSRDERRRQSAADDERGA